MQIDRGRDRFLSDLNVSRETLARFDTYAGLLHKWNPTINLVSRSSLANHWTRHFLDSAQLIALVDIRHGRWVDLGAGGGFPGMVCAILAKDAAPDLQFTLVESDRRKATFLRTVSRETSVPVQVITNRIEEVPPLGADILSARALAPLKTLLDHAARHLAPNGRALFMKGASFGKEMEEALESWTFQSEEYPSSTDSAGIVLSLGDIRRV